LDVFEKVDLAIKALQNAEEKTVFAPPASRTDLLLFNDLLAEAQLPQLPLDFMYLLSKFSACKGPYFNIDVLDGLEGAQKPEDVYSIDYATELNQDENDIEDKVLPLGVMPSADPFGISYMLFYKDGHYYHVENERGHTLHYFIGPDNIGDFILKELKTAATARQSREVEKTEKEAKGQSSD
jgi:hypothetical protein